MSSQLTEAVIERDLLSHLDKVIEDNIQGGYPDLMPFQAVRELLKRPTSRLRRLFVEVYFARPGVDLLNLLSTAAGAINLAAARLFGAQAAEKIDCAEGLDQILFDQWDPISHLTLTRNNNPTIPQRAISFACHMQRGAGRHGLLELGCSRGDIGRVLLSTDQFLRNSQQWFFESWHGSIATEELAKAVDVDTYLGVDLSLSSDDDWLLALWGLRDSRRASLANFYREFPPHESERFRRIEADITNLALYGQQVKEWLAGIESLTVATSLVLYQLTPAQRRETIRNVAAIREWFLAKGGGDARFEWFNQGLPAEKVLDGCLEFADLEFSRLEFRDCELEIRPLARLNNDACEGWQGLEKRTVRYSRILA
jgi:hypothetical protein